MAVTLQQIAEAAGVSRGTVDRALNNRGRIRPEVEERIKRIAREMGYQPSRAGRALAMAKRKIRIGVILQYMETPFMQQVLKGVLEAKEEVESFGGTVKIYEIEGVSGRYKKVMLCGTGYLSGRSYGSRPDVGDDRRKRAGCHNFRTGCQSWSDQQAERIYDRD